MNVVFFVNNLDSGGIENYLLRFLMEYDTKFDRVFVWCKSGQGGQLAVKYAAFQNVDLVFERLSFFGVSDYFLLKKFLAANEVDVVCDFTGNFSGRVLASAANSGVTRRIAAFRGSSDHFKKDPFRRCYNRWVRRLVLRYGTNIISNSQAAFDYFYSKECRRDKRFEVIYNGIKAEAFIQEQRNLRKDFGIPEDAFVVGHTGRFNSVKNHLAIVSVAERLVNKYDDVYFIMCGNGVRSNIHEVIVEKNIGCKVKVFDNRTDIPRFLNTMDCYLFPSITEGQPNSLIEAMVVGLPFVASDIASIRETVGDDVRLYSPFDLDSLETAIEERYQVGGGRDLTMASETIRRFDHNILFKKFFNVLSGVAGN